MSKKTYHIVDLETGKFVEEVDIRGFDNFVYQMTATGWGKVLRWVFRIAFLLCVVLTVAEPVLREGFPMLYGNTYALLLIGDIIVFKRVVVAARRFFRNKFKKEREPEKKEEEKGYWLIDPETERVVDTLRPEDVEDVKKQADTTSPADKFELVMSHIFMTCFLLAFLSIPVSFFLPDDWGWLALIAFMVFFVLMWFSELIRRYNPYDQKNKEASKFERTMAHFTFACSSLAVLSGIAAFVLPIGWARYAAGVAGLSIILTGIGESAWRSEKKDRESGDEAGK